MQGCNSNWSNDRLRLSINDNSLTPLFASSSRILPVLPQNVQRGNGPMTLGLAQSVDSFTQNNVHDVNSLTPLMNTSRISEGHRQNVRTWRPVVTGTLKPNSPESFVINFENINTPSSSMSEQSHEHYTNRTGPEEYRADHTLVELGSSDHQNLTFHPFQENNNSLPASNMRNHNFNNNINSNISTINSNSSTSNNNVNISLTQSSEGSQEVPTSSSSPEVQSLDKCIQKYIPFITFLFVMALYDHREGIFIFVGLLVTFAHANSVVKREIAKQNRRSLLSLIILVANLFVCICFIYFVFRDRKLYKSLILIPPYHQPLRIWDLLCMVGITDFVLKFITIQIKAVIACLPRKLLSYSSRGKWYLLLECSSQLYRGLAPVQPWLFYLMEAYQGSEEVMGVCFAVVYMVPKGTELLPKLKIFLKAFSKLLQNASLGVPPSKEELDTAGSQCPICHDEYNTPELLHCKHIFCEACIARWFDREQTCPLCRAKIADDPSWRDGATSYFIQLF